jgi:translation initiation factor 3 subunit D
MADFIAPEIQDNANGWGPCQVPEKFKDMPYQPFGKTDRLGKVIYSENIEIHVVFEVSDWTGATYTDRKYANKYTSTFASNHQYTYYYEDDDTSYVLVDNTKTRSHSRFPFSRRGQRGFYNDGKRICIFLIIF